MPGEVGLVFLAAALAEQDSSLPLAIALASLGCVLGDLTGYPIGRRFGLAVVRKWEPVRRRLEPQVEKAQAYFERRGGVVVFLARFVGALRAVVPIVAGTAKMPLGRFVAWDVPAAVIWSSVVMRSATWWAGPPPTGSIGVAGSSAWSCWRSWAAGGWRAAGAGAGPRPVSS